jgi:opacity protein-like surface antigen
MSSPASALARSGRLAIIFAMLWPVAALAQAYPIPYAMVTHESGTPPNVVSWGGYTAPGRPGMAGSGGRIYGPVIGLYNKEYAERVGAILNRMAQAANSCNRPEYDAWKAKWDALIEEAENASKQAFQYYQLTTNTSYEHTQALLQARDRALRDVQQLTFFSPLPEYRDCGRGTKQVGMVTPGPTIKLGGEVGWGGSRNRFEDFDFDGSGAIGGVSGQFTYPIGANTYAGLSASLLGSGVSGTLPDPVTSNIRWLVPVDGVLGATFVPSNWQWPLSVYGFGGLALGDVNISAPPFSATQSMMGWSIGAGVELQISSTWSVGLKYRHFDLGNANFSIFPGTTSLVSEHGDMVTGTLSYHFPISPPAPVAPILTK